MSNEKIVNSSSIQAYEYDAEAMTLSVTFKDGSEYDYQGVPPPVISKVFDSSGSIGSKFKKYISHSFKYTKTS